MLLTETLQESAQELRWLLEAQKPELAPQVSVLKIVQGCCCGDDFCASFYTQPKPKGRTAPVTRRYFSPQDRRGCSCVTLSTVSFRLLKSSIRPDVRRKLVALGLQI